MKRSNIVIVILCIGLLLMACDPPAKPDLVVSSFQVTGTATVNASGGVDVPVRVTIRNAGDAAAGQFKVAAEYTYTSGTFPVAFSVPGGSFWYPVVPSLSAGGNMNLQGHLLFNHWLSGETVEIKVIADSCSGDEFMPDYCRVDESDEGNNASFSIFMTLP